MIDEILHKQLDQQVADVKRAFSQKMDAADPGSVEAWAALYEKKIRGNFAGTARKTEFKLRYGLAKTVLNEIR